MARHEPTGRLGDQDGVGLRFRLHARGDVGRFAERQLLAPLAASHLAHDDQSGVDAGAHVEALATHRDRLHLLQDFEPGLDRAQGVVLVRRGVSEIGQDAVAQVLGDVTLVAADDIRADALIPGVQLAQIFRVHALCERGRPDQVHEEDGELPPLRGRLNGQPPTTGD